MTRLVALSAGRAVAAAGHPVEWVDGWERRGRPFGFAPIAQMRHGTASPARSGPTASLNIVVNGRAGIPGPLSHFYVSAARRGATPTLYVVAAGYANHAGRGAWKVTRDASRGIAPTRQWPDDAVVNRYLWGVEYEHSNSPSEPFDPRMLDIMARLEAAIAKAEGWTADGPVRAANRGIDHRESTRRKIDLPLTVGSVRRRVASVLSGQGSMVEGEDMIGPGSPEPDVKWWQSRLLEWDPDALPKYGADGDFGDETAGATKRFQRWRALTQTGTANAQTIATMGDAMHRREFGRLVAEVGQLGRTLQEVVAGGTGGGPDGTVTFDPAAARWLSDMAEAVTAAGGRPTSLAHVLAWYRINRTHFADGAPPDTEAADA